MNLSDIKCPADLKNLSFTQLEALGQQLRDKIISQVSVNGGHLAPNLGVIELTLALHFCYNTPVDKLVWDVGHQAYAHKLLTGRQDLFHTIRQEGGISGYPKRSESEYDTFGVGHASTSISAALGYCAGRNVSGQDNKVVAVIGDGSMTGGTAFEALNNVSSISGNLTIVLNDNKMSIAPNVGAFSKYLNRLISDPMYNRVRDDIKNLSSSSHGITSKLANLIGTFQDTAKHALMPGRLFEDLGVRYFGPIDGHDLRGLVQIFNRVRDLNEPCLVHVITEKGRGFKYAENDSHKWHGTVPFDPESGEQQKGSGVLPAYTKVFGQALLELAQQDETIVGITGAMPSGCGLDIVAKELPKRVFDVGIAEGHAVTFAAGLACSGIKPVVAIYSTFMQRAFDHVIHDVALQKLPVIFAMDRAGLVGADGPTHHGSFDISYMRIIPGMVIMAPSDQDELRNMLYTATKHNGPVAIRYPRGSAQAEPLAGFVEIPIGKINVVLRTDPSPTNPVNPAKVLLLGIGNMVQEVKKAAHLLKAQGVSSTVVDARFAKPLLPQEYQSLLQEHQVIVTLEDNAVKGGYGSSVLELMNELNIASKTVLNIGLPDLFVDHGEIPSLHKKHGMDAESVVQKIMSLEAMQNG
jgi:1-deoxy-D-xylulose-5-phosphate synthase